MTVHHSGGNALFDMIVRLNPDAQQAKVIKAASIQHVFQEALDHFKSNSIMSDADQRAQSLYKNFCSNGREPISQRSKLYSTIQASVGAFELAGASFVNAYKEKNGQIICGMMKDGNVKHGVCRHVTKDGGIIEACYRDNEPHGLSVAISKHGLVKLSLFSDGKLQAWINYNAEM